MRRRNEPLWRRYLRFWRPNLRADVDDEIAFHLEEHIDNLVAQGADPAAAREEALRSFGDLERLKKQLISLAELQERKMAFSERILARRQDAAYALRVMRSSPGFAAAVALTLALGIGATTAIFSVLNAALLRPLPYDQGDRVILVSERFRGSPGNASAGHYFSWMEQSRSFEAMAGYQFRSVTLDDGDATRVPAALVTPSFFQVQHMTPALGRTFQPEETAASRVVVLSWPLFTSRFGGDRSIVGKDVVLNGERHTVVGVMPPGYTLTSFAEQLWMPLSFTPQQRANYGAHFLTVLAKLKPGVTLGQAQQDLEVVTEGIRRKVPDQMGERGVLSQSLGDVITDGFARQLWVLFVAMGLVMLIGCANIASLLLARAMSRRKEIAIRGALGGSRSRLLAQLLTESSLLALLGGVIGLGVAQLGLRFFRSRGPAGLPRLSEAGMQWEVLLFAAGATILCGVVFGLAPALRATRVELQTELRDGGRGSRAVIRDRLRGALIVGEIAVALVLLVSAGLFLQSAYRLQQVSLGFEPGSVTMLRVALPGTRYDSASVVERAFQRLVADVAAVPGVVQAGAGTRVPMWGGSIDFGIRIAGHPVDPRTPMPGHLRMVTPEFFATIGQPIRRGRGFSAQDVAPAAPWVVVVNEAFARQYFRGEDPLGQRVSGWTRDTMPEWREIVGVVADVRSFGQENEVPPEIYMPLTQGPAGAWNALNRQMAIVAKTGPGVLIGPALRAAVKRLDPSLPVWDLQTMDDVLARATATRRFNTLLLTLLGAIGLTLAAIGIYGVIAYFVTQRTHEIGVRVALGASSASVIGLVVRQVLVLALGGIVVGGVMSYWGTKALGALLFETQPRDPVSFAAGGGVLLVVALTAAWMPARRASRVAPMAALGASG